MFTCLSKWLQNTQDKLDQSINVFNIYQNKTTYIASISCDSLTFFGLEICCTYSIAGLRIWSFFDIKTFIGGRPLFCIFKPIESSSAQNNPLAVVFPVCVCEWMCPRCLSASKWLWFGDHIKPHGKRKAGTADVSLSTEGLSSLARTQGSVPDTKQVNRCCLRAVCSLCSEWQMVPEYGMWNEDYQWFKGLSKRLGQLTVRQGFRTWVEKLCDSAFTPVLFSLVESNLSAFPPFGVVCLCRCERSSCTRVPKSGPSKQTETCL